MTTGAYNLDSDARPEASARGYDSVAGTGWLTFAAVMLGFGGVYNAIDGILAIGNSKVFAANAVYVFGDLNTWGWIVLVLGCLQLFAAVALLGGSELAKWIAMLVASLNAIGQLMFVPAYPFWSLALFTLDIWVVYAVAVYGGAKLKAR